jgi:3-dehydroquinate dehydratase-2
MPIPERSSAQGRNNACATCCTAARHLSSAEDQLVGGSAARLASPFRPTALEDRAMPKILIVHGAGMNMRGKVQTEIFGPMTLLEYDERIRGYAAELGLEIEIFHSNIEGEVVNKFYEANERGVDAALFNPAGFSSGYPALVAAISQVKFPTIEVHISNPVRRGPVSETAKVSHGMVTGFGLAGYALALRGVKDLLAARQ